MTGLQQLFNGRSDKPLVIYALQPIANAVYGGPILMKLAEQGLGVEARRATLDHRDYTRDLQDHIDQLVAQPTIGPQLNDREKTRLSRLAISSDPRGYPKVDADMLRILLRLIWFKDQQLAMLLGPAEKAEACFAALTPEEITYFSLLHYLEEHKVIETLTESTKVVTNIVTDWQPPERALSFDAERFSRLVAGKPERYLQTYQLLIAGQRVDADAASLLAHFTGGDAEQGPATLKI